MTCLYKDYDKNAYIYIQKNIWREGEEGRAYEDVEIIVDRDIEVVGEAAEVAGGPTEGGGAGEHGPESEQQNCGQCPESATASGEGGRIGGFLLRK